MEYVIFVLNLVTTVLLTINLGIYILIFLKNKNTAIFWIAMTYGVMLMEAIVLYMTDFVTGFSQYYTPSVHYEPLIRTILIVALLACYRMIVSRGFHVPFYKTEQIFCFFSLIFIVAMQFLPLTKIVHFIYNSLTWGYTFYMLIFSIRYAEKPEYIGENTKKIQRLLKVLLFFEVLTYLEVLRWIFLDTFILDQMYQHSQRTVNLEIITYIYNICGIVLGIRYLLKEDSPPQDYTQGSPDEVLESFSVQHALTLREQEILSLLVKRHTNKEIGDALFISVGTVKTHIHNIFTKTNVASRTELIELVLLGD